MKRVKVLFGMPSDPSNDNAMLTAFFDGEGEHIVCGGTSATVAASFLGKELKVELASEDSNLPPIAHLEGVTLVTEGILTMERVLSLMRGEKSPSFGTDGASQIVTMLNSAYEVTFYVGLAENIVKREMGLCSSRKREIAEELAVLLSEKSVKTEVIIFD